METNQTTAKTFSPSYTGGLEIEEIKIAPSETEYQIRMKRNGAFVAMTRCSVDAKAIAAIPEMLAALKRFGAYCEQNSLPEIQGIACDAFAAIAKAEGRA